MSAIALIGAPGSGKSTLGPLLAQRLDVPFVDVDAVIEEREGRSIRDIFAADGEDAFRALEAAVTLELLTGSGVVSLGGGAPLTPQIAEALDGVPTVWLQVDAHHAVTRIGLDQGRPLLAGGGIRGTLIALLKARTPVYASLATVSVDTNGREPDALVDVIVAALEEA